MMSDSFWVSFFGFLAIAFGQYLTYRRAALAQDKATESLGASQAAKAETVKNGIETRLAVASVGSATLAQNEAIAGISDKQNKAARVTTATHALVNSNMETQLKLNAVLANRMASLTHLKEDIDAAVLADKILRGHMAKQKSIDDCPDTNPEQIRKAIGPGAKP
jgi:hypothetical protein